MFAKPSVIPQIEHKMTSKNEVKRFGLLYGGSQSMALLYRQIERVTLTDATVLLEGESGTGKELIAQTIHQSGSRAQARFVALNCGAIPSHLIEAALFGHEKGSFTGALKQHQGYFEHACGGTLFLDEITEMPADMQVKLLRVLECGRFLRVGGSVEVNVDVRLIAATNRALTDAVAAGCLRQDLMYRLAVFPITVPPLRERADDVALLAEHFLQELNREAGTRKQFSKRALNHIKHYTWPGNVRELKNCVYRAYILTDKFLELDEPLQTTGSKASLAHGVLNFSVGMPLADVQRDIILATLAHHRGNKRLTAQTLGISVKTLYNRLKAY